MHVKIVLVEVLGVSLGAVDVCPSLGISSGRIRAVDFN
jgi:hypothetical protein